MGYSVFSQLTTKEQGIDMSIERINNNLVVNFDDYMPHFAIDTGKKIHVIPEIVLKQIADGDMSLEDLDYANDIMRVILKEWLKGFETSVNYREE